MFLAFISTKFGSFCTVLWTIEGFTLAQSWISRTIKDSMLEIASIVENFVLVFESQGHKDQNENFNYKVDEPDQEHGEDV